MIWESKYWKDELLANARLLKKLSSKRASERRSFQIQRIIFVSAYIIRKLWESGKLSSSWQERTVPCIKHPATARLVDRLNWHQIDECYQLDVSESELLLASEFCNRLIHSFVFIEQVEGPPKKTSGFYFASDKSRRSGLWLVKLQDVVALFNETGRDYPSALHMVRHPKTDEWAVWSGHGSPPETWAPKWRT